MSVTCCPSSLSRLLIRRAAVALTLLSVAALVGCAQPRQDSPEPSGGAIAPVSDAPPAPRPEADDAASIVVRHARASALPTGGGTVYLEIENRGDIDDRLMSIDTPSGAAELHETLEEDGVMRMRARPEGFDLPAAGLLKLEPGGKHAMLHRLQLSDGQTILSLSLRFEHAAAREVEAPITAPGGEMQH